VCGCGSVGGVWCGGSGIHSPHPGVLGGGGGNFLPASCCVRGEGVCVGVGWEEWREGERVSAIF